MKYVVDASVAFKWAIVEQGTSEARKLRAEFRAGTHDLIAPDAFPIEMAHAITRTEPQRRITPHEGAQLLADILQGLPILHHSLLLLPRAYEISSVMRIGVYDCLYVALAEREKCGFVTADEKLVQNLGTQFPCIVGLSALP